MIQRIVSSAKRWMMCSTMAVGLLMAGPALAAGGHGEDEHGGHLEVNWVYGILGESAELDEPTLLFRTPGMPVPLIAYLINSAILFTLLFKLGKGPIMSSLAKRREDIMRGMDEAAAMRREATEQLELHEARLQKLDAEIERIRTEMRQSAEAERAQILTEAKKRRERMERDAKHLIAMELKNAKEELLEETVRVAMRRAEELLTSAASDADHERLCEEYLGSLQQKLPRVSGGQA